MKSEGTVVDVRTPHEFRSGHVSGSINIPLPEVQRRLEEIRSMSTPLVLVCATGNRSGIAQQYLMAQGIECENGGSWLTISYEHSFNTQAYV